MNQERTSPEGPARAASLVESAAGSVVSRTLIDTDCGKVTLFSFDRGQQVSEHTTPYEALVLVLEGTALFRVAGVEHEVGAGELLLMPAGVPHSLSAPEPFRMLLVMIGKGS
ncbi:cupin domain-containing protein [Candidatus Fermentibacterales bacterium]|nr:cupin domain-containing protein [Candidatus Fermentibacterales bacterium]